MSGRHYFAVAALLLASACSKSSSSTPKTAATATPTPTPFAQHLYVANAAAGGGVSLYALPLVAGEAATYTVAVTNADTLAFDSASDLAVGQGNGQLNFYHTPFTASSTPTATFPNGGAGQVTQVAFFTGTLYAATGGTTVNAFTPPFSNATTPSATIAPAGAVAQGVAFDAAGNLYISNPQSGGGSNLFVYAPPYTGTPVTTPNVASKSYRQIAVLGSTLFVGDVTGTGSVDAYTLPLTATSVPAYTITSGVDEAETVALDSAQRLYVGNVANGTITVYETPFGSTSVPTTTLTLPAGALVYGLAVGP